MFSNTLAEKGKGETRLEGEEKWNGELVFFFFFLGSWVFKESLEHI